MLLQYIRDHRGNKVGLVMADVVNDTIKFGYSRCNLKKDRFNSIEGRKVARKRLEMTTEEKIRRNMFNKLYKLSPDYVTVLRDLWYRSIRYFKNTNFCESPLDGGVIRHLPPVQ